MSILSEKGLSQLLTIVGNENLTYINLNSNMSSASVRKNHDSVTFKMPPRSAVGIMDGSKTGLVLIIDSTVLKESRELLLSDGHNLITQEDKAVLSRVVECLHILNSKPKPICRDCGDENGVCPHTSLDCDMQLLIQQAKEILDTKLKV